MMLTSMSPQRRHEALRDFASRDQALPGLKVHRWITVQSDGKEYLISPVSGKAIELTGASLRTERGVPTIVRGNERFRLNGDGGGGGGDAGGEGPGGEGPSSGSSSSASGAEGGTSPGPGDLGPAFGLDISSSISPPSDPGPGAPPGAPGAAVGPGSPVGGPVGEAGGLGDPGSLNITLSDLARAADVAPFSLSRLMNILRALVPGAGSAARGTRAGAAADALSALATAAGPAGSVLGGFARATAADAAARGTAAMTARGFTPNPVTLDAIISLMTGPTAGGAGGEGQAAGQMTAQLPEPLRPLAPALETPTGPVISPAARANIAARFGGGFSPAFLEAFERLRQGA